MRQVRKRSSSANGGDTTDLPFSTPWRGWSRAQFPCFPDGFPTDSQVRTEFVRYSRNTGNSWRSHVMQDKNPDGWISINAREKAAGDFLGIAVLERS